MVLKSCHGMAVSAPAAASARSARLRPWARVSDGACASAVIDGVAIRPVEVPVPLCKNVEETHRRVYLVIGEIELYQVRVGPCLVGAGVALDLLMLGHPVQIPVEARRILLKLVQHPGPVFKSPFRIRVPPRKAVLGFAQIAALHLDGGNVLIIHRANGPLAAGGCGNAAQVAHGVGKHKLRVPPLLQQLGN